MRAAKASRSSAPERAFASATPATAPASESTPSRSSVGAADVAVAILRVGPDDRHGDDRQQRGGLGLVLVEAQHDDQAGHEQHPTADSQQAGDDSGRQPDHDRGDHRSTNSTALATSTAAKSSEIHCVDMRCCSQVPITTPPTAGIPMSTASSTCTLP